MRITVPVLRNVILLVVLVSAGVLNYAYQRRTPPLFCKDCNVLVIAIDPLRADSYGRSCNSGTVTPVIDSFVKEGYEFTDAVAVSSWTLPSAMSMMTGAYPSVHGVINKELIAHTEQQGVTPASLSVAAPNLKSLVAEFRKNGYRTAGFAGGAALAPQYGFNGGFDEYRSDGDFESLATPSASALEFVRAHPDDKLFLYVHGFDVHGQYMPPEGLDGRCAPPQYRGSLNGSAEEQKALREQGVRQGTVYLTDEDVQFLRSVYDEKVSRLDERIGTFLSDYATETKSRNTIVVLTSNHGDEFYEHGRIDHGMTLYDEVIRIPLVISVPGARTGIQIGQQVRNIDILPTLMELVGIPPGNTEVLQGVSLVPAMTGIEMNLDAFPETSYRYAVFLSAVRSADGWKLISDFETGIRQLYRYSDDLLEQMDRYGSSEPKTGMLLESLRKHTDKVEAYRALVKGGVRDEDMVGR